MQLIVYIFVVA